MPFQAIPIAMAETTGSPLSKLVLIYVTARCEIGPYNCWATANLHQVAFFAQADLDDTVSALKDLCRLGHVYWVNPEDGEHAARLIVSLPVSSSPAGERKRIKATEDQIELLLARQDGCCTACGSADPGPGWHVDHIIPRSKGGADVEQNCQVLCSRCNSRKGARVHWLDFLGGRE